MALPFFSNDFLTIDIGFRYIKVIQARKRKNNEVYIVNFGIGDTPKGCIKNGAIKDQARIISEIKKIIANNHLNAKDAKIVVSGTNIVTRIILIDDVSPDEIDRKIWSEITTYLPIDLDDHNVDYKIIGRINEDNKEKIKIFVTAVPKRIINSYLEIIRILNLKPISVDIPANSISKFFQREIHHRETLNMMKKKKFLKIESNTLAVIDLGSEMTSVNILNNKMPEFNRVILLGSSNIDATILKNLNMDNNQIDQAERYKRMYGLVKYQDFNNALEWECSEATKIVINEIIKNIKMCFDFYIQRCAGEPISKIYLIGGGSLLKGLRDHIEDIFDIQVYVVSQLEIKGIELANGLNDEKFNFLVTSIGITF